MDEIGALACVTRFCCGEFAAGCKCSSRGKRRAEQTTHKAYSPETAHFFLIFSASQSAGY